MAKMEHKFTVSQFASEGGRRDLGISLEDPTFDPTEAYNNRLKFIYNQAPSPDLQTQDAAQMLQNAPPQDFKFNPSVDTSPSVTPFPMGCPTGFYQQGNVCVPMVGTYPDQTSFSPPAGTNFPKGVIQQVVAPQYTFNGAQFQIKVYFENNGSVRGKFYVKVSIPDLNITDQPTTGVWVPANSNAILYKNLIMPATAAGGQMYNATLQLLKLDEATTQLVADDAETFTVPGPGVTGTTTPPPVPGNDCFQIGLVTYCVSATPTANCIQANGKYYCPQGPTQQPPPGQLGDAVIMTVPAGHISNNQMLLVNGHYYQPGEIVYITFRMIAHGGGWEGRVYNARVSSRASYNGQWAARIRIPALPSAVQGSAIITAAGAFSRKMATTTIDVV